MTSTRSLASTILIAGALVVTSPGVAMAQHPDNLKCMAVIATNIPVYTTATGYGTADNWVAGTKFTTDGITSNRYHIYLQNEWVTTDYNSVGPSSMCFA